MIGNNPNTVHDFVIQLMRNLGDESDIVNEVQAAIAGCYGLPVLLGLLDELLTRDNLVTVGVWLAHMRAMRDSASGILQPAYEQWATVTACERAFCRAAEDMGFQIAWSEVVALLSRQNLPQVAVSNSP